MVRSSATSEDRRVEILCDRDELVVTWTRFGPHRDGASPHIHRTHSDLFFVLGGELTFFVGPEAEERVLPAGTLAFAPPLLVHGFRNAGDGELRYLNFHAPSAGFADYLRGRTLTSTSGIRPRTAACRLTDADRRPAGGERRPHRPGRDPDRGAGRAGAGVGPTDVPLMPSRMGASSRSRRKLGAWTRGSATTSSSTTSAPGTTTSSRRR